jgi:hypothetical protein
MKEILLLAAATKILLTSSSRYHPWPHHLIYPDEALAVSASMMRIETTNHSVETNGI